MQSQQNLTQPMCFRSKEPEPPEGEPLSVAQMKAQRIEETFENPFRMVLTPHISFSPTPISRIFRSFNSFFFLFRSQYLPCEDIHVNQNAKFDPSSKMFEVTPAAHRPGGVGGSFPIAHGRAVAHSQISKKWKLLSVEKQQQELEAKRKGKQEAKEQAKKATGDEAESCCFKRKDTFKKKKWFLSIEMCCFFSYRGEKESQAELPGVSAERRHRSPASGGESLRFFSRSVGGGFELCQRRSRRPCRESIKSTQKSRRVLPRDWQTVLKICQVNRLHPLPLHHETWLRFPHGNVSTLRGRRRRSAAPALAAFSYLYLSFQVPGEEECSVWD